MSYLVAQRMRDFGIRLALGARPWAVPVVVVVQALRYTVTGIVLGLAAAVVAVTRLRSLLFDVDPRDPAIFAGVAFVVACVAAARRR